MKPVFDSAIKVNIEAPIPMSTLNALSMVQPNSPRLKFPVEVEAWLSRQSSVMELPTHVKYV